MTLNEFKEHIESFPQCYLFPCGISYPFSWRGVYAEVAFEIRDVPMSKEIILESIESAYNNTFHGYEGGEYRYDGDTDIHFEIGGSSWTDGRYALEWINFMTGMSNVQEFEDIEETLVKLAFE